MLTVLWGVVLIGAGILSLVNGVQLFECESVSFSRLGTTCYLDSAAGAVPGWLGATGLLVLGSALILGALGRFGVLTTGSRTKGASKRTPPVSSLRPSSSSPVPGQAAGRKRELREREIPEPDWSQVRAHLAEDERELAACKGWNVGDDVDQPCGVYLTDRAVYLRTQPDTLEQPSTYQMPFSTIYRCDVGASDLGPPRLVVVRDPIGDQDPNDIRAVGVDLRPEDQGWKFGERVVSTVERSTPPAKQSGSSGEATDVNAEAIGHARVDGAMAEWLREAASQVDRRLDAISPAWREAEQAEAARACAFGLLLAHLARTYPHAREAIRQVVEAHPSYEALPKGYRLQTLERITDDQARMASWMRQLVNVEDPDRMSLLLA